MRLTKFLLILILPISVFGQEEIKLKIDGLKKEIRSNGYNSKEVNYYDSEENLIYTITYDSNGIIEDSPMGIAIIHRKYDEQGNLIVQSYYDQNKKLYRTGGGYGPATVKYKYDKNKNKIETMYCNEKGEPLSSGLAIVTSKYDKKGNLVEERQLNSNRHLIDDACIFMYAYDSKCRVIEESIYDNANQLIKTGIVYKSSIRRYKYDNQDRVIELTMYNENNKLINGEARIVYDYTKKPDNSSINSASLLIGSDPQWVEQIFYDKNSTEIRRDFQYLPSNK